MRNDFHGIYPMLYTFYDDHGGLDHDAFVRQIEACIASGVHGIALLGIVGEYNKLDIREKMKIVEWALETVAGRVPVAVTVSEPSEYGQREFARAASQLRPDWLILQPPAIRNVPEREFVRLFGAVADRVDLPIAIQNNPVNLDVVLSASALLELHRNHPNICLLKGEGPILYVRRLIEDTQGVFKVFNGRGGLELPASTLAGCVGLIPAPELADVLARSWDLMISGDGGLIRDGERLHADILPLLTYLMANPEHMLCYGRDLFARRAGITTVNPRHPCVTPHEFGMRILERLSAGLTPLPA
ncbi:dihydrodipicolinate synthase family protein [Candidimonas nitroreducens]|uniref:Dihydrodipicolinate synthase family protein n=1 Tax=Candidimonas nitroreducens TaxID=683354 RepID=A0A225MG37_9BURK|nr:dihydrodipicolinate synthase family protein [Candidimonas nitroreducens]OWT59203.1 dihydrodipicolinate synthase family protein [Candidimonas nitroreducens]